MSSKRNRAGVNGEEVQSLGSVKSHFTLQCLSASISWDGKLYPFCSACWASETCLRRHVLVRPFSCVWREVKPKKGWENRREPPACSKSWTSMWCSILVTVPNRQLRPLHHHLWHLWQSSDIGAQRAIHHGAPPAKNPPLLMLHCPLKWFNREVLHKLTFDYSCHNKQTVSIDGYLVN